MPPSTKNIYGVREARTLDLRITKFSYETYALANCATTPMCLRFIFYFYHYFTSGCTAPPNWCDGDDASRARRAEKRASRLEAATARVVYSHTRPDISIRFDFLLQLDACDSSLAVHVEHDWLHGAPFVFGCRRLTMRPVCYGQDQEPATQNTGPVTTPSSEAEDAAHLI
jgi:hypothetical protein